MHGNMNVNFRVYYTRAYRGSSISYIMYIERLSSKYFYRTCDVYVLFKMNKYAETCRLMLCVKDEIKYIFKRNVPFLRSVFHTMGYSTPKTLFLFTLCSYVIPIRYGLDGPGFEPRWRTDFFLSVQTGLDANSASCTMDTGYLSRGQSGRGVALNTHSHLASRLKKEYSYTSTFLRGELYLLLTLFKDVVSINRLFSAEICV
jgi:hypothetical protein